MRKLLLLAAGCIALSSSLSAECCDPCASWPTFGPCHNAPWSSAINIYAGGGYRQDKFKWSIAGPDPDNFPNTLSEVQWKNLKIAQLGVNASYTSCRNYVVRIDAAYGRIYHGNWIDSDYLNDGKENPFSIATGKAGKGHVYDLSGAVGYRVTSSCRRFIATPLVGYAQYSQYLHMYSGNQRLDFFNNDLGPFPGLKTTYNTRWFGPWIGIDFFSRVERCAYLFGSVQWHMLSYRGHGRWNLRPDLGPFYHKAYGYGYLATLGGNWEIWSNWSIGIVGSYRMFRTKHGHEHVTIHLLDGDSFDGRTRFNGAIWHSWSASAIVAWRF